MDISNAHDLRINEGQFSDVHGDENTHHHDHSLQMDGRNNTATILHADYRGGIDNRIINENCSNMVIYGQGQNCKVTLNGIEFPFHRSRNRQATSRKSSTPVRNADQAHVPKAGGQNDTGTGLDYIANQPRNYNNTIINNGTGQTTIIGQGENSQVCNGGIPSGNDPSGIVTSSADIAKHGYMDTGTTVAPAPAVSPTPASPLSSAASAPAAPVAQLTSVPASTPPPTLSQALEPTSLDSPHVNTADVSTPLLTIEAAEQRFASGVRESLLPQPATSLPLHAAYVAKSKKPQEDNQAQASALPSPAASIVVEGTNLEPANPSTTAGPVGEASRSLGVRSMQTSHPNGAGSGVNGSDPPSYIGKAGPPMTNELSTQDVTSATDIHPRTELMSQEVHALTDTLLESEGINQKIVSTTGTRMSKSNKRRKNIFLVIRQGILRILKGSK